MEEEAPGETSTVRRPRIRLRAFRIGLRKLLVVIAIIAVGLGWMAAKLRRAREQGAAVRAIQKVHGTVTYDYLYHFDPMADHSAAKPPGPRWLRSWLGDDVLASVARVDFFRYEELSDGDLKPLAALPDLEDLGVIQGRGITDAGLVALERLTKLNRLSLVEVPVTDAGLVHLRRLRHLESLDLGGTGITDAGLAELERFRDLKVLDLGHTRVTAAGLEHLKGLTKLRFLDLTVTPMTDADLEPLKEMRSLKYLGLGGTFVTDAGERTIREALPGCQVTWWHRVPDHRP